MGALLERCLKLLLLVGCEESGSGGGRQLLHESNEFVLRKIVPAHHGEIVRLASEPMSRSWRRARTTSSPHDRRWLHVRNWLGSTRSARR